MIKIGVIITLKNGVELFVYRELSFLESRGVRIYIFPTKQNMGLYNPKPSWVVERWNLPTVLISHMLTFTRNPKKYILVLIEAVRARGLVDFLLAGHFVRRMTDVDLIYTEFGDHKFFTGYFCKKLCGKPLAVTIHAYELYNNPNPPLFLQALKECDLIMTVSEYNREYLHEHYGIDPTRVELVRLSVDLEEFKPEKKFVILIVAYFTEKKGHEILLRAVKQLGKQDIEVWVVGDYNMAGKGVDVRRLARELAIEPQVVFFGKLGGRALKALYLACDVFCLPSRKDSHGDSEGFPTVLVEALAYGKPIITTRHVEIPRIIPEILVDENDVEGLAKAIEQVYQSPTLLERLGKQNRSLAEKYFSTANVERELNHFLALVQRGKCS